MPRGELEKARDSHRRCAWDDAFRGFERADQEQELSAEDLELMGWAAGMTGRDGAMLAAIERAYHLRVEEGDCARAAWLAFFSGFRLFSLGEAGRAGGWIARCQRLLERVEDECAVRGYMMLPTAMRKLAAGDNAGAAEAAAGAAAVGERCDEPDLLAFARQIEGRARIRLGEVEAGLALLDESMVAATAGELSPIFTGLVYCTAIATCQQVYALDRSKEWTRALSDWCEAQPQMVTFAGNCLVHRAEVMQLGGNWPAAIEEAERARKRVSIETNRTAFADACYQQGEIHRMRGELAEAERAYREASEVGGETQPGLALLRLAQGRADAAASAIDRVLDTTHEVWRRARFLPACVEIHLARGELDRARVAADELASIAERFGLEPLVAMAAHARGAVLLADGDPQHAAEHLRRGFALWQSIGAPYIAARIRALLGEAYRALGDADGAELEASAANKVLEQLGAATARAARPSHGMSPRELEVLVLVAGGMTNKAIGDQLCLSERTIDRHVSNIFRKLDVSSRTEAAAFAYEHGLV